MELDWDFVDTMLQKHIKHRVAFKDGLTEIKEVLNSQATKLFDSIEEKRLQSQFSGWLCDLLKNEPIPKHIKALYFGIFSMVDPSKRDNAITTIHLTGSPFTPQEDEDWACEVEESFLPENRYLVLDDFVLLDKSINSIDLNGEVEVLVFNGLLNLLILTSIDKAQGLFLANHKTLYLGSGYDAGDTYVIGKLTDKGLINGR